MKRPAILIFVNAMILVMVLGLLTQSLFAVQRRARARAVQGRVEVRRGDSGAFVPLSAGASVAKGDVLRAGPGARAELAWSGSASWLILQGTEVSISQAKAGSAHRPEHGQLALSRGKLVARTASSPAHAQRFEVRTPEALALAQEKGSIFGVESRSGRTRVQVWQGSVKLSDDFGQAATISQGEVASTGGTEIEVRAATKDELPSAPCGGS